MFLFNLIIMLLLTFLLLNDCSGSGATAEVDTHYYFSSGVQWARSDHTIQVPVTLQGGTPYGAADHLEDYRAAAEQPSDAGHQAGRHSGEAQCADTGTLAQANARSY